MKKSFSMLVLLFSFTSIQAATSATLLLSGSVPRKMDIALDVSSVSLDLATTRNNFKIATVTEKSNSNTGYKVTIASSNKGVLKRSGGNETFPYTLRYGSNNLNSQSQTVGDTIIGSSSAGVVNASKDLFISYNGVAPESMVEGSYEDTLNLTISAN